MPIDLARLVADVRARFPLVEADSSPEAGMMEFSASGKFLCSVDDTLGFGVTSRSLTPARIDLLVAVLTAVRAQMEGE